jgi:hypothetical protein
VVPVTDLSVLVGGRSEDGGGGTDLALIVAVSVVVPVAVVLVLGVIVAALVIAHHKRKLRHGSAVNFDEALREDGEESL